MATPPTMKVLYGPPGTGKTWLAARHAVAAVRPKMGQQWAAGAATDAQMLEAHRKLVLEGRIKWVTFHPSYSYEDFVEGFRPVRGLGQAGMAFEVQQGPFRDICDVAAGRPSAFGPPIGAEISAVGGGKTYEVLGANDQGWFLRVRPNRADQVGEEQEKFVTRRVIQKAADLGMEPRVFSIPGKGNVTPADYGLPGDAPVVGSDLRRQVATLLGISSSDLANSAHFGAVATFIKEQSATPPKPVRACLVIDEINRADLSRVFGELITLLEPDKRTGAPEERLVHLPYSREERFGVPPTLSVIGTMNTADRSITTMDFAMRRRFTFEEVAPDPALCPEDYGTMDLRGALAGINRRIEILRGADYRIGHASLMVNSLEAVREQFGWANDLDGQSRTVAYIFRRRVVPLLYEYFHEDWRKVEVALAVRGKRFGPAEGQLLSAEALSDADREQFDEVFDTEGITTGKPSPWWDPGDDAFDADAWTAAVAAMQ